MTGEQKKFFIVNNFLVVGALFGAAFDLVGMYATFFAISVAYQISFFRRKKEKSAS